MKNIKVVLFGCLLAAGMVTGCGRNNNQNEGAADSGEVNNNTYGTEYSESDMGSGGTVDTTASGQPADTVQGSTTRGEKDM